MIAASFNVNSLKMRLPIVLDWLKANDVDVLMLQELKGQTEDFPYTEFEALGYQAAVRGQKAYNGVAIISRLPMQDVWRGWPSLQGNLDGEQARLIGATIGGVRMICLYLPNGNPIDSEKFPYKLDFLRRLIEFVRDDLLPREQPFLLAGDFNICPGDEDCYDPIAMRLDALCHPKTRALWHELIALGLWEAWRSLHPLPQQEYSYWDYMAGRFPKDQGLRIDHFLLSPQMADRLRRVWIDKAPRRLEKPSDHTPILCEWH